MEENNKSDNLITTEKPTLQNIENPYIVISESSDEPNDLEILIKGICLQIFLTIYLSLGGSGLGVTISLSLVFKAYEYLAFILLDILPLLLVLFFLKKKLILRKNNKQLTIFEQNYLFCSKKYYISLENIDAHLKYTGFYQGCKRYSLSKLFIYGIDSTKINFDTKNIKNVPHKFFYTFENCVIDQNTLYNFLGINASQKRIIDEINLYLPKKFTEE